MIKKVVFRQTTLEKDEPFRVWVVSYDNSPDRKFFHVTQTIAKFTAGKKPSEHLYSNGKTRVLIWE